MDIVRIFFFLKRKEIVFIKPLLDRLFRHWNDKGTYGDWLPYLRNTEFGKEDAPTSVPKELMHAFPKIISDTGKVQLFLLMVFFFLY
jgi:hypothetical protein